MFCSPEPQGWLGHERGKTLERCVDLMKVVVSTTVDDSEKDLHDVIRFSCVLPLLFSSAEPWERAGHERGGCLEGGCDGEGGGCHYLGRRA